MSTDPRAPPDTAPYPRSLRYLATGLNTVTIILVITVLAISDTRPWLLVVLALLPWIAIALVARFQPIYRFGARRGDPHPDLTLPLMVPGLVMVLPVLSSLHTLDWKAPLAIAGVLGIALAGAAALVDPWFRQHRWNVLLVAVFACAYGYAVGMEINAHADPTDPRIYPVHVLTKHVSRGSKSTTWYLKTAPWGPYSQSQEVSVSSTRYRETQPGDLVCVYMGRGAVGIAWYRLDDCSEGTRAF
ncbi:MAG TPA: hypothetical protein VFB37_00035 [Steroidobacteraceae bacterium]|nr:hypothetical protein [Steroidobacteraceae bacterium]